MHLALFLPALLFVLSMPSCGDSNGFQRGGSPDSSNPRSQDSLDEKEKEEDDEPDSEEERKQVLFDKEINSRAWSGCCHSNFFQKLDKSNRVLSYSKFKKVAFDFDEDDKANAKIAKAYPSNSMEDYYSDPECQEPMFGRDREILEGLLNFKKDGFEKSEVEKAQKLTQLEFDSEKKVAEGKSVIYKMEKTAKATFHDVRYEITDDNQLIEEIAVDRSAFSPEGKGVDEFSCVFDLID